MQGIIWSLHLSKHRVPALLAYSRHSVKSGQVKISSCLFFFLCLLFFPLIPTTEGLEQAICLHAIEEQKNCSVKTIWSAWRSLDSIVLHLILTHQEKPITYISIITRQKLVVFLWLLSLSSQPLGTICIHSHHTTLPRGSLTGGWAIHRWDRWVRKWLVHGAWQIWRIWHWRLRVSRGWWQGIIVLFLVR